jgi:hypothetical protein
MPFRSRLPGDLKSGKVTRKGDDLPVRAKSARLKARPIAPVEAKAKTLTVLPSELEDRVLNRLTADLSEARRRFAFALNEHKSKFWSDHESRLHAPENGDYFEKHKKQWIHDVRASLTNRHGQLINLQPRCSAGRTAVDRVSQLMVPVVNDECNLVNVLRNIAIFGEFMPAGIPERYGRDSLTADLLSKLLARLVESEFTAIREEALVRAEQPPQGNEALQTLPVKQTIEGKQEKADHQEPIGSPNRFVQLGDVWSISFDGKTILLSALVGLRYLQEVIRCAGYSISAGQLISLTAFSRDEIKSPSDVRELEPQTETDVDLESNKESVRVTNNCINKKSAELTVAKSKGNESDVDRLTKEIDVLKEHLKSVTFMGKPRSNDRNRVSVTQAINRAIKEIKKQCPALGAHLRDNGKLVRGQAFCYLDRETVWDFSSK